MNASTMKEQTIALLNLLKQDILCIKTTTSNIVDLLKNIDVYLNTLNKTVFCARTSTKDNKNKSRTELDNLSKCFANLHKEVDSISVVTVRLEEQSDHICKKLNVTDVSVVTKTCIDVSGSVKHEVNQVDPPDFQEVVQLQVEESPNLNLTISGDESDGFNELDIADRSDDIAVVAINQSLNPLEWEKSTDLIGDCKNEDEIKEKTLAAKEKDDRAKFKTDNENKAKSKKARVQCEVCKKSVLGKFNLKVHMRLHTGEKPYCCKMCNKRFTQISGLKDHMGTHGTSNYKCKDCGKCYSKKSTFKFHLLKHTDMLPHICERCGKGFSYNYRLNRHKEKCYRDKPTEFVCEECGLVFEERKKLRTHLRKHNYASKKKSVKLNEPLEPSIFCDLCGKMFTTKSHFSLHMRVHSGSNEKRHKCEQCKKCFYYKAALENHAKLHSGAAISYACSQCEKIFSVQSQLRKHEKTHTGNRDYKCEICHRCYATRSSLNAHIPSHKKEKPYGCPHCDKFFAHSSYLNAHIKSHSKQHTCTECGKAFAKAFNLERHIRWHKNERMYSCEICGKTFIDMTGLKSHQYRHIGYKPHACQFCEKSFTESGSLARHVRIHTGEKPYKCKVCGQCFNQSSSLKNHVKKKHNQTKEVDATTVTALRVESLVENKQGASSSVANKDGDDNVVDTVVTVYVENYSESSEGDMLLKY